MRGEDIIAAIGRNTTPGNGTCVVAETENIGRAAEQMNISQSPLSRQILQLEGQLGLSLFERARQSVRLTDEGHRFLEDARRRNDPKPLVAFLEQAFTDV